MLKSLDLARNVLSPSFDGVRRLPAVFDDLDLGDILSILDSVIIVGNHISDQDDNMM